MNDLKVTGSSVKHRARPGGALIFLSRGLGSAGDENAVVPAIT